MLGPMSLPLAARIIALAAEGLHFAHELRNEQGEFLNLVHRDISPDNILVSRNGAVKVVDFGIAKATSQPHLTKSGMIKGKMAYMPPEQLAREPLDRRADLFALGIVLLRAGHRRHALRRHQRGEHHPGDHEPEAARSGRRSTGPTARPRSRPSSTSASRKTATSATPRASSCRPTSRPSSARRGETVGTREVAQLVETVFANEAENTMPHAVSPSNGFDATAPASKSVERVSSPPAGPAPAPSGMSATALRSVESKAVQRSRTPLVAAGVALLVAVGGIGGYLAMKDDASPLPPQPPVLAVVDAGAPQPDAAVAAPAVDAGEAIDAGEAEEADAGVEAPKPVAPRTGKLELRIRPYATVYLDDKLLGDTPLPPIQVTVGKHTLRLVNPRLKKDVELQIVIKPGENLVKHNLKE